MKQDIFMLQDKTRKYKTRATDAERQVQTMTVKVAHTPALTALT